MKTIICQHCGKVAATIGIGKVATSLTVTDICDALKSYKSVKLAAQNLKCSRALVYKILKANGLTAPEVLGVSR